MEISKNQIVEIFNSIQGITDVRVYGNKYYFYYMNDNAFNSEYAIYINRNYGYVPEIQIKMIQRGRNITFEEALVIFLTNNIKNKIKKHITMYNYFNSKKEQYKEENIIWL